VSQFSVELKHMVDQLAQENEDVSQWVKESKTIDSVTRLPGDASTRKYYRVISNSKTYILMHMESFQEQQAQLPFLVVQGHLLKSKVDVPKVLEVDAARGFILLEDLGDVTLLRKLQDVSTPDIERHLYERVIDSLVQLQVHASPQGASQELDAFKLRFDHEKLMWEVNFTIENFYQLYLKRNIASKDLKIITDGFSEICSFLAQQPTVLTHRDFHSRNVMVTHGADGAADRLVMIDFQDARMGPPQYDLASLLKDSYYQLEESQVLFLVDYYIARFEALSQQPIDRPHFIHVFDLMAVQRNFKAIGSFASFMNKRGDPTYLKFIGNTFENIRRNLLKYPRYTQLREVLFHYYYF
jgi:aminoglycoside/choline kinase family phosphotransferase